jgi:hypothetical protein
MAGGLIVVVVVAHLGPLLQMTWGGGIQAQIAISKSQPCAKPLII